MQMLKESPGYGPDGKPTAINPLHQFNQLFKKNETQNTSSRSKYDLQTLRSPELKQLEWEVGTQKAKNDLAKKVAKYYPPSKGFNTKDDIETASRPVKPAIPETPDSASRRAGSGVDSLNQKLTNHNPPSKGFNTRDDIETASKPITPATSETPESASKRSGGGDDPLNRQPGFLNKASEYLGNLGKQAGDIYSKHSTGINTGLATAALGGLGYAAYKKLKNDRAAKKANAKMMA